MLHSLLFSINPMFTGMVEPELHQMKSHLVQQDELAFAGPMQRLSLSVSSLASIQMLDIETGQHVSWHLIDLRETCETYYDQHVPESSIEILGHAVGGITYRHYAHRDPLAFRAIMTIPQPSAFLSLVKGHDGECPCCRRAFVTAD